MIYFLILNRISHVHVCVLSIVSTFVFFYLKKLKTLYEFKPQESLDLPQSNWPTSFISESEATSVGCLSPESFQVDLVL